ncbi:hypothetical protein [Microvirgula aerodenitrificans]|uniref:gp53-like domain-containing protein n=1 Tax=Microvirgula aerodenitrificans TaxID=57480 RepID=UPI0028E42FA1|nr:hypothetical protein [Microvirgula aerodenitrificans]
MADISLLPTTGQLSGLTAVQKINEALTSLNEANRLGVPAWSSTTSYGAGALTWDAGQTYKSTVANSGQRPSTTPASWVSWGLTLSDLQNGYETMAEATGTAGVYAATYWPAITGLANGQELRFKVPIDNTGGSTLSVNAIPAAPILSLSGATLQRGELVANGVARVRWSATRNAFILLNCEGGTQTAPTAPQFDAGVSSATTAFVQRALGNWRGFAANTAGGTFTLAAADAGKTIVLSGSSVTGTLALPKIGTVPDGAGWLIKCEATTSNWSIATHADDGANMVVGLAVASVPIRRGDYAIITRGGGSWRVHGSVCLPYGDQFTASLAASGYQMLPGGLILQWGTTPVLSTTLTSVAFPIAFPSACRSVALTNSTGTNINVGATNITAARFDGYASSGGNVHRYIAIGI